MEGESSLESKEEQTSALKSCSELSACRSGLGRKRNAGARQSWRIGVLSASQLPPSQAFPPDKALLLKCRTSGKVLWREE